MIQLSKTEEIEKAQAEHEKEMSKWLRKLVNLIVS